MREGCAPDGVVQSFGGSAPSTARSAPRRSSSTPSLRNCSSASLPAAGMAIGRGHGGERWVSAAGTGGFHVLSGQYGETAALHDDAESRRWIQRRRLQAEQRFYGTKLLEHPIPEMGCRLDPPQAIQHVTGSYDINGKIFHSMKNPTPNPEQTNKSHWLCQINGVTSRYNILSNKPHNPSIDAFREEEVKRMKERITHCSGVGYAGSVQPQRDVASYDIPGFVPSHQRMLYGGSERSNMLFS